VKITVSHERTKEEAKQAVNRSLDDVFKSIVNLPVELLQEQRIWEGDTLKFSLVAKMGLTSTPIRSTIDVTDRDVTVDVELGVLERLIPAAKVRDAIGNRVKGLLR
jgi:Putative polyhydroxyalkanoic acid system protein (PHA_gran_rgn)